MLRAGAVLQIVTLSRDGRFALARKGPALVSTHPRSVRAVPALLRAALDDARVDGLAAAIRSSARNRTGSSAAAPS